VYSPQHSDRNTRDGPFEKKSWVAVFGSIASFLMPRLLQLFFRLYTIPSPFHRRRSSVGRTPEDREVLAIATSITLFVAGGRHYSMAQFLGFVRSRQDERTLPFLNMTPSIPQASSVRSDTLGTLPASYTFGERYQSIHPFDQYRHQRLFCCRNDSRGTEALSRIW